MKGDYTELHVENGGTPMTVADAIIKECCDREWLEDVIYYLNAFITRAYGGTTDADSD